MKTIKPIDNLRTLMIKDIKSIPYFIDPTILGHADIWMSLQLIIRILSKMTTESILTDRRIQIYHDQIQDSINYILLNIDQDIMQMEVSYYIEKRLQEYEAKSLELELYEVCSNLQKFRKLYENV
jgi:hypothetical protein